MSAVFHHHSECGLSHRPLRREEPSLGNQATDATLCGDHLSGRLLHGPCGFCSRGGDLTSSSGEVGWSSFLRSLVRLAPLGGLDCSEGRYFPAVCLPPIDLGREELFHDRDIFPRLDHGEWVVEGCVSFLSGRGGHPEAAGIIGARVFGSSSFALLMSSRFAGLASSLWMFSFGRAVSDRVLGCGWGRKPLFV